MVSKETTLWDRIMNGIKNLALLLVLGGVGYLVYQHLYGAGKPSEAEKASRAQVPALEIPTWGRSSPGQKDSSQSGDSSPGPSSPQLTSQFGPSPADRNSLLPDPQQSSDASPSSSGKPTKKPTRNHSAGDSDSGNGFASGPETSISPEDSHGKNSSAEPFGAEKEPSSEEGESSSAKTATGPSGGEADGGTSRGRPEDELGERFIRCMQAAHQALRQGQWTEVLLQLSPWYRHPDLTRAESEKLTELLDQLAGSVIYSREHRLEPAYRVRPGDNLVQIARQYQVSWELLAKINGIRDPYQLEGVEELKVLRGPFHALVDLTRRDITLMLEFRDPEGRVFPLYGGRFPIRAISGVSELEGEYEVLRKSPGSRAGQPGPLALELSQQVVIHGPLGNAPVPKSRGSLELSEVDMDDIYDILTIGSRVLIRR